MQPSPWIAYSQTKPLAKTRLFCFPYAGAGAGVFRSWVEEMPETIDALPAQLPGREYRVSETPMTDMDRLAETLAVQLRPWMDRPFALFGYSLGALTAFELTRVLRRTGAAMPIALFVAAFRAPHLPPPRPAIHNLPEAEFARELRRLDGTAGDILDNPAVYEFFAPILRADFKLLETYSYKYEPPLSLPIHMFGGEEDREVGRDELAAWRFHTDAPTSMTLLPGGHFFLRDQREKLIRAIVATLEKREG